MVALQSKIICGLFLQSFKILVKEQIKQKANRRGSEKLKDYFGNEMVVEMHIYGDRQNG